MGKRGGKLGRREKVEDESRMKVPGEGGGATKGVWH